MLIKDKYYLISTSLLTFKIPQINTNKCLDFCKEFSEVSVYVLVRVLVERLSTNKIFNNFFYIIELSYIAHKNTTNFIYSLVQGLAYPRSYHIYLQG